MNIPKLLDHLKGLREEAVANCSFYTAATIRELENNVRNLNDLDSESARNEMRQLSAAIKSASAAIELL